jgi:multidrug transporter EmrE-like cation transporter
MCAHGHLVHYRTMEIAAPQNTLGWIIGGSLLFSIGAGFMKASMGFTRPLPSVVVAVAFLFGSVMVTRAVMTESMSTALVVGLGIEAVASVMIGMVLHGERVSPVHGMGMALIVGGVGVLRLL